MAYAPCRYGIHVCGINCSETEFVTVANHPGVSRSMFDNLRSDFALDAGEDPDLVIDFMCDGDIIEDFGIRRQSLNAMAAIIAAETFKRARSHVEARQPAAGGRFRF